MPDCNNVHPMTDEVIQTTTKEGIELFAQMRPAATVAEVFDILHPMTFEHTFANVLFGDIDRINDQGTVTMPFATKGSERIKKSFLRRCQDPRQILVSSLVLSINEDWLRERSGQCRFADTVRSVDDQLLRSINRSGFNQVLECFHKLF